ncbi:unnamed protein product [Cunninghamella echinulata]
MTNKIKKFINKIFNIININTQTNLTTTGLPTTTSIDPPTTSPANSPTNVLANDLRAITSTALPTGLPTGLPTTLSTALSNTLPEALSTTLSEALSTAISTAISEALPLALFPDDIICKPGNEWTFDDLDYFKIKSKFVDEKEFFGQPVDKVALNDIPNSFFQYFSSFELSQDSDLQQRINKENKRLNELMFHMDNSFGGNEVEESGVVDFTTYLLYLFDYNTWKRVICTKQRFDLDMACKTTYVTSDICIMDVNYNILFLVQEDKWYMRNAYPKAEIIAGAVAAFQHNNSKRKNLLKKQLDTYTFPGLTIRRGGSYIFYKITITQSLCDAVKDGICPETTTSMVQVYTPFDSMYADMLDLSCRKKIMQCLKLFKDHIKEFDTDQPPLPPSLPSTLSSL